MHAIKTKIIKGKYYVSKPKIIAINVPNI